MIERIIRCSMIDETDQKLLCVEYNDERRLG